MIRSSPTAILAGLARAVLAASLPLLAACYGGAPRNDTPDLGYLLGESLPVAAAALAAGQIDAARRLYLSLAQRFPDAPEPVLGLGYIAWYSGNLASAQKRFLQTAELAKERPAMAAEALLGAGRVALARGETRKAREIFERAREPARDTPSAPWILNGLAVAAALDGDHEEAAALYAGALRLSPANPRITANYVRSLLGAGRVADAGRLYHDHPASFWKDEDGAALSRLIDESRRQAALARQPIAGGSPPPRPSPPSPERPPTETARIAAPPERPAPPPSLALELSDFALSPSGPADGGSIAPPDPSALVLRLADWPGPISPPALNGEFEHASYWPSAPESPLAALRPPEGPAPAPAGDPTPLTGDPTAPAGEPPPVASGETGLETPAPPAPETLTLTVGQSHRLHLAREATAISVASPDVADVQLLSPTVLYVIGKTIGRTSLAVLVGDRWHEERLVTVELDLAPLEAALAGARDLGDVRARLLARGVALAGEVASAEAADRALRIAAATLPEGVAIENELRIAGPQQVNLEVQIAEVNRSVTENLGVSWEAFRIHGPNVAGARIGRLVTTAFPTAVAAPIAQRVANPFPQFPLSPAAPWLELSNAPFEFPAANFDGADAASLAFGRQSASTRIGAMLDALATAGLANVLARPNVTAISGESASFFSGGEFPLPSGVDQGTITFTYKKYGVLLDFVPTVVDSGRIVLTVRPEVSEPSLNLSIAVAPGINVPVMNVRRAETTVEVGDGESIVIAGLFRNASNTVESGVPGLKDVPLLGALFGNTETRSEELELIVIVTARLVNATVARTDTLPPAKERRASGYRY